MPFNHSAMSTESFHVSFNIKREKVDAKGFVPIYTRVTIDGQRTFLSTKRKIIETQWDKVKGRAFPLNGNLNSLNKYLEVINTTVYNAYSELLIKKKRITIENLRRELSGDNEESHSILSLVRQHNREFESLIGVRYSTGSYKNYKTTLKLIEDFIQKCYSKNDLHIEELTYSFANSYYNYLVSRDICNNNGAVKHIQRLKKITLYAYRLGIIAVKPLENMQLRLHPYSRKILDWKDLMKINNLDIVNPTTNMVRKVFLIQCYTGLAYSDIKKLSNKNISSGVDDKPWIFIERTKTKTKSTIPLLPQAAYIINQFVSKRVALEGEPIIPVLSNQKMNKHLKTIAQLASINISLSTHVARHTFATTVALSNGVPIETVSKMLGHTNIRTTQIYAKVIEAKISIDMNELMKSLSKRLIEE